ncbi:hypothetical protein CHU98_g3445 [Xylaria longipes]|nr:hypothetical protein CHU98_g3445 [Xylaria longipes]
MPTPPPPLDPVFAGQDRGPTAIAASSAIVAFSTLFVMARLWVRVKIMRKFELDDLFIVVADVSKTIARRFRVLTISKICAWISVGFAVAAVKLGSGRHIQILTTDEIQGAILFTFLNLASGILSFCLPKLAIVKLFSVLLNPSRSHLIWLWSISIFNLLILLGCLGVVFGQCYPSESQWNFSVPAKYCWNKWNTVNYTRGVSAFSAFVDLYLSIYPATVLYKTRLPTKKKVALSALLGIGSISTVVAVYKITTLGTLASVDFTCKRLKHVVSQWLIWIDDSYDLTIFTLAEGSVITIAACIPLLQPLLEMARQHPWSRLGIGQSTYPTSKLSDDKSRIQKMRRKFEMDSILATKNDDPEAVVVPKPAGTQFRTLNEDETALVTINAEAQNDGYRAPPKSYQGIYRTNDIHISYARNEAGNAKSRDCQSDWA